MLQDVFESEEFAATLVLTPQQESHYLIRHEINEGGSVR